MGTGVCDEVGMEADPASGDFSASHSHMRKPDPETARQESLSAPGNSDIRFNPESRQLKRCRQIPRVALSFVVLITILMFGVSRGSAAWKHDANGFASRGETDTNPLSAGKNLIYSENGDLDLRGGIQRIDEMKPQEQAEALLELAIGNATGAVEQISTRSDHWRGVVQWNQSLASLTTAALNSNDLRVRQSGIEVELAAYGIETDSAHIDRLVNEARSLDHSRKIWALWTLGLMANRGIQTARVLQVLGEHSNDSDEDSRKWSVDALSLVGASPALTRLLQVMHDDPSPEIRERAASGVAQSGMLTHAQRLAAIPRLLEYSDDPALDAQTRDWAFEALNDITGQRLPHDSSVWRNRYSSSHSD